MRACIFGAGAVGGHLAAKLSRAGHDVSVVTRGEHLDAIKSQGLVLHTEGREICARVKASDDPADLGPQDLVISTLKATSLETLADGIAPLLATDTAVVFAQNGMPWWYAQGLPGHCPTPPSLEFLDPGGKLRAAIEPRRVVGAVIHSSNEVRAPGVIVNDPPYQHTLIVGEIDDRPTQRIQQLRATLQSAEIDSPPTNQIRSQLWAKLIGNMAGSTLCMLTRQKATMLVDDPALNRACGIVMREGAAIAAAHGIELPAPGERRGPQRPPDHKPSILQDYERGRSMEIDALLLAPQAFARAAKLATPGLDVVAAVAARLAMDKGLCSRVTWSG